MKSQPSRVSRQGFVTRYKRIVWLTNWKQRCWQCGSKLDTEVRYRIGNRLGMSAAREATLSCCIVVHFASAASQCSVWGAMAGLRVVGGCVGEVGRLWGSKMSALQGDPTKPWGAFKNTPQSIQNWTYHISVEKVDNKHGQVATWNIKLSIKCKIHILALTSPNSLKQSRFRPSFNCWRFFKGSPLAQVDSDPFKKFQHQLTWGWTISTTVDPACLFNWTDRS